MTDTALALDGRARQAFEAMAGASLAVALITVAHAALPDAPTLSQPLARASIAPATPRTPQPPPALIAFQSPLPGYDIDSPFGMRQLPWEEQGRLHAGVDIAAPSGQPILAAADGVVVRTGQDAGYGRFVEVKHAEGLTTLYAHMGAFEAAIAPGRAVKAGQALGRTGSTGTSTGAHLHFEIHDAKDRPMNPAMFLGRRFAEADDLPLKAALRAPRQVRIAYVSNIPKAKRELMAEREQQQVAADAAASAGEAGIDASFTVGADGRPRARLGT